MWVLMLIKFFLHTEVLALSCLSAVAFSLSTPLVLAQASEPAPASTRSIDQAAKALVVLVYDQHCKAWCTKVRPIMKELGEELGEDVVVVEIDSSADVGKTAIKTAEDLGIIRYYKDVDMVPVVMIFDSKKKLMHELGGPKTKDTYKCAILSALKNAKNK
ncbi:MAG: Thioredoxin protein [Cyanobacteriota bacterium erpe_2018_sw_21hr_WHONDRS-SW48-000092_B_bin.40]|nr:Thioredoxin protein [Cyanobacteriota bacterium erpe_2018_sw_21hr_WHONDRS-SW48-000092_B_bin.40]